MPTIIPATPRDVTIVAANMRPWDRAEFSASATHSSMTDAALACLALSRPWAGVALIGDEPVAAFGAAGTPLQPQLKMAWAFGTDRFRRALPAIAREVNAWKPLLLASGVHRIEARCLAEHDLAGRFMALLGARREAVLAGYGTGGEDFELWAWCPPRAEPPKE